MKYEGKLYARVGGKYTPITDTATIDEMEECLDKLENENFDLKEQISALKSKECTIAIITDDGDMNEKCFVQPAMLEQYGFELLFGTTYKHKGSTFTATIRNNKLTLTSDTMHGIEFDIVNEVCLDVIMTAMGFQKNY